MCALLSGLYIGGDHEGLRRRGEGEGGERGEGGDGGSSQRRKKCVFKDIFFPSLARPPPRLMISPNIIYYYYNLLFHIIEKYSIF